jgi:hypothetical protein
MIYDHGWNGAEKFLVLSLSFPISRRTSEPSCDPAAPHITREEHNLLPEIVNHLYQTLALDAFDVTTPKGLDQILFLEIDTRPSRIRPGYQTLRFGQSSSHHI